MAELVVSAYRFIHPDGSSKDWAIAHDAAGVRIFYGKTSGRLRAANVPAVRCRRQSPATEALAWIREQERQGYHGLGRFRFDGSSHRLLGPARETAEPVAPIAPVSAAPRLYWERRPRDPHAMAAAPTPAALPALGEAASAILQTSGFTQLPGIHRRRRPCPAAFHSRPGRAPVVLPRDDGPHPWMNQERP